MQGEAGGHGDGSPVAGGSAPVDDVPLLGREREMAELRRSLADAEDRHTQLCLLAGESGIGKTSLAKALVDDAARRGALVRWGRSWEAGGAPAYWPWVQVIR